jgi:hypothetical protein
VIGAGEELVAEDDRIIGRAFRWSLCIFVLLAAGIGVTVWVLNRPRAVEPVTPVVVTPPKSLGGADIKPPAIPFADITVPAGVDFIRENGAEGEKLLPETMGGGVAFLDIDNDGDQDLLLVNSAFWPQSKNAAKKPTHALYRNNGKGEFTNITDDSGLDVSFYGMGVATGDYDNDGDSDVYITAVGRNHLFENDGSGAFEDVSDASGTGSDDASWSTSAGFFDYDNDGDLDLFVSNYVKWSRDIDFAVDYTLSGIGRAYGPPTNFQGANNQLYRNKGDGTFEDVIVSGALTSYLLVLAALDPGVTTVVSELLSRHVGTHELYLTPIASEFVGDRFLDILSRLKETDDLLALGVQHADGHNRINPSPDYVLQAGDQLFVVAAQRPDLLRGRAASTAKRKDSVTGEH